MSLGDETWEASPGKTQGWVAVVVLAGLVGALYLWVLSRLVLHWWEDPDYNHGFVVPLFVAHVLWRERARWRATPLEPSNVGLGVMLGAVFMLIAGSLAAELFVTRLSLIVVLAGMVLFLAGRRMLRALAFPLAFLVFMIPLPALVYNQVTTPLQFQASRFAAAALELLRVPVLREGNLLYLPNYTLEVVEACSGIRSLMSLMALAVAYGYLTGSSRWIRIALVVLTVPIAVASNGLRIVGTGVLTYLFGPQSAEGFFHLFSGWLIFLSALFLIFLAERFLRRMDRGGKPKLDG